MKKQLELQQTWKNKKSEKELLDSSQPLKQCLRERGIFSFRGRKGRCSYLLAEKLKSLLLISIPGIKKVY